MAKANNCLATIISEASDIFKASFAACCLLSEKTRTFRPWFGYF